MVYETMGQQTDGQKHTQNALTEQTIATSITIQNKVNFFSNVKSVRSIGKSFFQWYVLVYIL